MILTEIYIAILSLLNYLDLNSTNNFKVMGNYRIFFSQQLTVSSQQGQDVVKKAIALFGQMLE